GALMLEAGLVVEVGVVGRKLRAALVREVGLVGHVGLAAHRGGGGRRRGLGAALVQRVAALGGHGAGAEQGGGDHQRKAALGHARFSWVRKGRPWIGCRRTPSRRRASRKSLWRKAKHPSG